LYGVCWCCSAQHAVADNAVVVGVVAAVPLRSDPSDYDKIDPTDRISILGLKEFAPGSGLTLQVRGEKGA